MEYQCVMCPEEKCSKDCPTLDVLPYEEPFAEENIRKARKLIASGRKVDEIKESLRVLGNDVAAKNELINKWIEEYDAKEKDPLYHIIRRRAHLIQLKKILAEKRKILADRENMLDSAYGVMDRAMAVYEAAKYEEVVATLKMFSDNN